LKNKLVSSLIEISLNCFTKVSASSFVFAVMKAFLLSKLTFKLIGLYPFPKTFSKEFSTSRLNDSSSR
jgi:hypothetical protein